MLRSPQVKASKTFALPNLQCTPPNINRKPYLVFNVRQPLLSIENCIDSCRAYER